MEERCSQGDVEKKIPRLPPYVKQGQESHHFHRDDDRIGSEYHE